MSANHTPTPWTTKQRNTIIEINGADGVEVCKTSWHGSIRNPYPLKAEATANMEFIVQAVNAYAPMVEALRQIANRLDVKATDRDEDFLRARITSARAIALSLPSDGEGK